MTNQQHPITPPPELVDKWNHLPLSTEEIIAIAWRHGADQELEACIDWIAVYQGLEHPELLIELLRNRRRPKPPSLKQQALEALDYSLEYDVSSKYELIRRALEQLND